MAALGSSPRPNARFVAVWLAGLLLAAFSGMAAFGAVFSARAPLNAVGIVPESGRVYADAADAVLKQAIKQNQGALPKVFPQASVDWAREAFANEPLAVEAPRIIALADQATGKTDEARRIMRLLPAMSKREAPTNVWLSQDYAQQGDEAKAFEYFDMTLRVSESSAPLIIPPLVDGLDRPDLRNALAKLLRAKPQWEDEFWTEAVQRPKSAPAAMQLRMQLGKQDAASLAVDQGLVRNLVSEGRFGDALEYYRFLTGKQGAQDLRFPFERAPAFAPLDWDLLTDGNFSSSIEPAAGKMLISTAPATRGVAARRLLALEPGSYRAAVQYAASLPDDVGLGLTLRCAEKRAAPVRSSPFAPASDATQTLTVDGSCRYYLLEIDYTNSAPIDGIDFAIDSISLRKES